MHHHIFPQKDCFLTNRSNLDDKNFGVDELLQIGTQNIPQRVLSHTTKYYYTDAIFNGQGFTSFTGIFTGSLAGTVSSANGTIYGDNLEFTSSYFSGSTDIGYPIQEISGMVYGTLIDGLITGSVIAPYIIGEFMGQITDGHVCLTGTGSGYDTVNKQQWTTTNIQFIDRSMLKFDLTEISKSIVNGDIVNPQFSLKVKVCNEYDLPITYAIYALPVSQSWNMGDGYLSDGGSDFGASWQYSDNNNGTSWYSPSVTGMRPVIDYITDPTLATASFGFGGGNWHTSSVCSQSFQYESSDIDMDVTSIVNSWLDNSVLNEGFILVSSDELIPTGSGFILKFFSRDTNTIYSPYLDVMWDDVSLAGGYITGSAAVTSSVVITYVPAGISASIVSGSSVFFTSSNPGNNSGSSGLTGYSSGVFSGSAFLSFTPNYSASIQLDLSASGFVNGTGLSGTILGVPVIGVVSASISLSSSTVTGPCGNSFAAQLATGSFYGGVFSGSLFTAYYVDYKFENAFLYGPLTSNTFSDSTITITLPPIYGTYSYGYIAGPYINGNTIGTYTLDGPGSASYYGQFTDGNYVGTSFLVQLTGSIVTASYSYTSSVEFTSSLLSPMNTERSFTISLQNVSPVYKAGDIIKIGVFGRKQFPLKYFGQSTQQEQYMIPEYLPTQSFYSIKDNETNETVINFDEFTRIGCEYPNGNYFLIDTTGLPQDRYYRVIIRVEDGQTIHTIDCGKAFKLTR